MCDYYRELEVTTIFENEGIRLQGPCVRGRMNLLAVSEVDKSMVFIAFDDTIYVYRLDFLNDKLGEPFKKLRRRVNSEPSEQSHVVNAIKVGKIGNEEVLVSVDEAGDVRIWFTANLDKNPIRLKNVESTWGIAIHGPKRLLAVSANSHNITIFNLQESVQFFNDDYDDDDFELIKYASVLINYSSELDGKAITVLRGHEHNIPTICFSSCGQFLVSCSLDSTCRIWNTKTGELEHTKIITSDWYYFYDEWGWTANFVPKSAFKTVSSNCEAFQHLTLNSTNSLPSPRSVGTIDSLDLYRQYLGNNLDGQRTIVRGVEDLYRMRNLLLRNGEYEDGYIDDDMEDDMEDESNDDPDLESIENDEEEGLSNSNENDEEYVISDDDEIDLSATHLSETEGNATPAYYDFAESATPVVENYTEDNPDYRWSVGHELNIINNEQNEMETDKEKIIKESSSQPVQNNVFTVHGYSSSSSTCLPAQPSYSPSSSSLIVSEDMKPTPSNSNPNFSSEISVSPQFTPLSPQYFPTTPQYSPISPHYFPTSPHYTPQYSPTSPQSHQHAITSPQYSYSPTSPENIEHSTQFSPIQQSYSPTISQNLSSPSYSSVSPTYSPVSPECNLVSREPSPSHSSIMEFIVNDSQQELPSRHDDINDVCIEDSRSYTSPDINNSSTITSGRFHIHHKRIEPLSSSQSDSPNSDLSDELVLYTTKNDLFILDPKSNLKILRTEKDVVFKVDTRRFAYHADYDRLNMVEVIPELSLIIVASQQGKIALTRLIKIVDDDGNENYYLHPEKYLPITLVNVPLVGMLVVKNNTFQDPSLYYYRLYLMYCNGIMFCYEIRRRKETNPLRMDNIFI